MLKYSLSGPLKKKFAKSWYGVDKEFMKCNNKTDNE